MTTAKVLLVDDVRVFIEFERPFFERAGCSILTATSGPEALRLVREEKPHIVLLDYEMPGMAGDEVCRRIRQDETTRHIPVLIVSTHAGPDVVERCQRAGCTDFLSKPVTGRQLLEKVVRILQIPYRVHLRTRVHLEVTLGVSGDAITVLGYSEDISEGGMLAETLEPLETASQVRLEFTLPSTGRLITTAEVVRVAAVRSRGMYAVALRFLDRSARFRETIRAFVEQEVGR